MKVGVRRRLTLGRRCVYVCVCARVRVRVRVCMWMRVRVRVRVRVRRVWRWQWQLAACAHEVFSPHLIQSLSAVYAHLHVHTPARVRKAARAHADVLPSRAAECTCVSMLAATGASASLMLARLHPPL